MLDVEAGTVDLDKSATGNRAVAGITNIAAGGLVVLTGTGGDQIYGGSTSGQLSAVNMSGGTLDFDGKNESWDRLTGTGLLTNSANGTASIFSIGESGGSGTYSGTIADGLGTLALTKNGAGTTLLNGTNGYSGGTIVNNGILQFNSAIPSSGSIAINNNAVVAVGGNYGTGGAIDQALLNAVTPSSSGVVALAANSANNLDFNVTGLSNVSLGSVGNNTYSGVITPGGNGYLLGGGGGIFEPHKQPQRSDYAGHLQRQCRSDRIELEHLRRLDDRK